MVPHSSILAWEIPWTEEPGGLQPMESKDTTEQLGMHVCACVTHTHTDVHTHTHTHTHTHIVYLIAQQFHSCTFTQEELTA